MKIIIAPDSFKESMSALDVAQHIAHGFQEVYPNARYTLVPIADGGEGTVQALITSTHGQFIQTQVTGPLGEPVVAEFGVTGDGQTAVVEMASASGLALLTPEQRHPLETTSYGTGQLLLAAAKQGVKHIILGVGGSATNDGGAGLLQAIGVHLLDAMGQELKPGGGALNQLVKIDASGRDPIFDQCQITIACDVTNPLLGPQGASHIFGPQKGADPETVSQLEANLTHFAKVLEQQTGRMIAHYPGTGAGGGINAALLCYLNAELHSGVELIMSVLNLEEQLKDADLVITGEGRIDSQSIHGKVPIGVARLAKKYHKPVIGIAGSLSQDVKVVYSHGLDCVFSVILSPCSLETAFAQTEANIRLTARNIAKSFQLGCLSVNRDAVIPQHSISVDR
ncbi:glycerate kinase [Celerinatantimonas yamalensis]|uniref:Glycerate kinase n=1 Tax=Celerinatantimonas yamalensis TaxID=559956 RepID=A0ABW9G919_9GAMM